MEVKDVWKIVVFLWRLMTLPGTRGLVAKTGINHLVLAGLGGPRVILSG